MMRRVLTAAKQKWMTSNSRNAAANYSFDIAALNVRKIIGLSIKRHVRSS
jgi:hypothetical protein